ncbi:hypothetical protein [Bradyrhizobium sp. CCBAU 11445]|uniref:hypothetical protein n=1 Tax=Bradyrhizobium sp. CCBAU 11445 TaxID=1630896 RepID=UPI0023056A65|nr:hypothetical protein [Bradyrhizobium sp. CCBAU 11445]
MDSDHHLFEISDRLNRSLLSGSAHGGLEWDEVSTLKSQAKALLGGNLRNDEGKRRLLNLPSRLGKSFALRSETESALFRFEGLRSRSFADQRKSQRLPAADEAACSPAYPQKSRTFRCWSGWMLALARQPGS